MGLFANLFPVRRVAGIALTDPRTPIRSPWSTTNLSRIAFADIAGVQVANPGRAEAMRIPSIVRGRALIAGLLSRLPLALYDDQDNQLDPAPWMHSTTTGQSPRLRHLWTLDDLIFSGLSLWALDRADDGTILDAIRVPPALWNINTDDLTVQVNGQTVSAEQVCLFEGPQEGLVTLARDTITAAAALESAWSKRVQQPVPMIELHSTDATADLEEDEAQELVDEWEKQRREGGGTAYTPSGIQLNVHGTSATDLFIEGRNALRLDVANFLSLPASLLEGSLSTASLTYSTSEGERSDLDDLSLSYWAMPFEARLSQDDITPDGTHVAFDQASRATAIQPAKSPAQED